MQYLGGKSRLKKDISSIINKIIFNKQIVNFYSLFCGAANVESLVKVENKFLNDAHPTLIKLYKELQNDNFQYPDFISEDEYKIIKENMDYDDPMTAFVGFACSWGGKFFGGYARGSTRNYAETGRKHTQEVFKGIKQAVFSCEDYKNVEIKNNSLIYCDPPYFGTTQYGKIPGISLKVEQDEFWNYMRKLSKNNIVLISELNAPDDFVPIWEKIVTRSMRSAEGKDKANEKLFILKEKKGDII